MSCAGRSGLTLDARRGPPEAGADLVGLDLDGGPLLAVLVLPGAVVQSPGHDHAGTAGQGLGHVLAQAAPAVDAEVRRLAVLPATGTVRACGGSRRSGTCTPPPRWACSAARGRRSGCRRRSPGCRSPWLPHLSFCPRPQAVSAGAGEEAASFLSRRLGREFSRFCGQDQDLEPQDLVGQVQDTLQLDLGRGLGGELGHHVVALGLVIHLEGEPRRPHRSMLETSPPRGGYHLGDAVDRRGRRRSRRPRRAG